ncbi:hypothetical protein HYH03_017369 [Edaphochlamys debaryana]|uniref:Uncharacterized protein n=1 Tax=Edaphochlamys debaryana TaxID=47281 RepID=A0A835XII8_9CHLO|nr:hypothetical protein HYH03_017369 [Edaphochlamys debaryana]|eukprot:KAG2483772.1 hypothetical protein HYH03_017369 [Edaphochlamys debaryana]
MRIPGQDPGRHRSSTDAVSAAVLRHSAAAWAVPGGPSSSAGSSGGLPRSGVRAAGAATGGDGPWRLEASAVAPADAATARLRLVDRPPTGVGTAARSRDLVVLVRQQRALQEPPPSRPQRLQALEEEFAGYARDPDQVDVAGWGGGGAELGQGLRRARRSSDDVAAASTAAGAQEQSLLGRSSGAASAGQTSSSPQLMAQDVDPPLEASEVSYGSRRHVLYGDAVRYRDEPPPPSSRLDQPGAGDVGRRQQGAGAAAAGVAAQDEQPGPCLLDFLCAAAVSAREGDRPDGWAPVHERQRPGASRRAESPSPAPPSGAVAGGPPPRGRGGGAGLMPHERGEAAGLRSAPVVSAAALAVLEEVRWAHAGPSLVSLRTQPAAPLRQEVGGRSRTAAALSDLPPLPPQMAGRLAAGSGGNGLTNAADAAVQLEILRMQRQIAELAEAAGRGPPTHIDLARPAAGAFAAHRPPRAPLPRSPVALAPAPPRRQLEPEAAPAALQALLAATYEADGAGGWARQGLRGDDGLGGGRGDDGLGGGGGGDGGMVASDAELMAELLRLERSGLLEVLLSQMKR